MNAKCFYCNIPRGNPCPYKNLADCKEQRFISDIARIYIDVDHNNIFKG